jgi:hypothetical protein
VGAGGVEVGVAVGTPIVNVGVGVLDGVGVEVKVGVMVGVEVTAPATIVRMPVPVRHCASGLQMVTFFAPVVAEVVLRLSVTVVGVVKVALLTTTPPVTVALR